MKDKEQNVKRTSIITSTVLKTDTADSNERVYSKEALAKAAKEYMEKKKEEGEMIHEVFFGSYKGTEDGRLVEVDFGEMWEDMFGRKQTIDEEIKEQSNWLANKFSAREGYTTTEELLLEMGQFVKNRMLDKYNLENE